MKYSNNNFKYLKNENIQIKFLLANTFSGQIQFIFINTSMLCILYRYIKVLHIISLYRSCAKYF